MSTPYDADTTINRISTRTSLLTRFESNSDAGEDRQVKPVLGKPLNSVTQNAVIDLETASENGKKFQLVNGFCTYVSRGNSLFTDIVGEQTQQISQYAYDLDTTITYTKNGVRNP